MDLLSERSSPDKNPLMMNPVPTGFATGNNAMNEEMNMKTKLSFNILICRVLLCLTIVSARLAAKFFRASSHFTFRCRQAVPGRVRNGAARSACYFVCYPLSITIPKSGRYGGRLSGRPCFPAVAGSIDVEQEREVAGIGIMLRPKDNVPFAAAIDTLSALMGSIAESLDLYTVEPSNSTKTVLIPLRFAPDRMSAYNSVEVFPSGDAPQIVIRMILDNGEEKTLYVATVRAADCRQYVDAACKYRRDPVAALPRQRIRSRQMARKRRNDRYGADLTDCRPAARNGPTGFMRNRAFLSERKIERPSR